MRRSSWSVRHPLDPRSWQLANVIVRDPVPPDYLRRYYQASDVLLLPSVGEGLPLVVQEASCCGVAPLISSEIIEAAPEFEPFAHDAGAAGQDILASFAALMARPESHERRTERARYARELWSWDRCGDAYTEMFRSLCYPRTSSAAIST